MSVKPIVLDDSDVELDDIEHHFKVTAGPGAGKTRWLTNHMRNVLSKSRRLNKCRKIACITYTNMGVETIIKRIGDSIDKVEVSTIHSFLYKQVVKPYIFLIKDEFGLDPAKVDGHDEIIPSLGTIHKWKSDTKQMFLDDDKKIIDALCNLCWKFGANDQLELKLRNVWDGKIGRYNIGRESLQTYKRIQWERSLLHHEDVLFFSLTLLKRYPDILRILRGKFPYYFIDEFQDTNPIQTNIIEMLAGEETIIGVIGDKAQSIYEFQGADVRQFEDFNLSGMVNYQIENNHRSTQEILTVLNHIRKDLTQISPDNKRGPKPLLLICPALDALRRTKEIINSDNVCTLSYANVTSCEMKTEYVGLGTDNLLMKLTTVDSDRGKVIAAVIRGIEYARQKKFKDAIKQVAKCSQTKDAFEGQKTAVKIIHAMLNNYDNYVNGSLLDFYINLLATHLIDIAKINTTRVTKVRTFYEEAIYKEILLWIKYNDDDSLHRTIHKAKGDEFDNVLVIVKSNNSKSFNEEKELSFLLNPDLSKEEHRVYYVALSRAKVHLYINVPSLSDESTVKLKQMGFDIEMIQRDREQS
jgi:DNA helicase-2/ATP-dependent DNA helicase PcrA